VEEAVATLLAEAETDEGEGGDGHYRADGEVPI
jgi:hypothetical protein